MPNLPNVTVQQLEYLLAVGDGSTWSDAAQQVGVSPSALSQGLAELERRVGVPLFERDGRRRRLTATAGPVLAHARTVVAATIGLARWADGLRSGTSGTLHVGMIDAAAVEHFPRVLRRFRTEHPDVGLRLSVAPSAPLLADLSTAALDIVVCVEPPSAVDGVEYERLRNDDLAVYAPPELDAGVCPVAEWGPWVTFPAGSHTRSVIARRLAELGVDFRVVAESHQPEVLREMVKLGLGWTVLPVVQAESGASPLVRARPKPISTRQLVIARRIDAAPLPAADELVRALKSTP